jgi:alkylhydroperoxidase family enzyme
MDKPLDARQRPNRQPSRSAGCGACWKDYTLTEARALHQAAGFREAAPFNSERYAHHWFEKVFRPPWTADLKAERSESRRASE